MAESIYHVYPRYIPCLNFLGFPDAVLGNLAAFVCLCSTIYSFNTPSLICHSPKHQYVFSQLSMGILYRPVHTGMYSGCTSTYSSRSSSHFIPIRHNLLCNPHKSPSYAFHMASGFLPTYNVVRQTYDIV